jgi:phosphate transport system substrate-binding protein
MVSRTMFILAVIIVAAAAGGIGYYLGGALKPGPTQGAVYTLTGGGATFPFPLLSAMSLNYSRQYPNVQINYNSIGSGGGINGLIQKTFDFAASDAPLNDAQRAQATNSLHIPETIGAVVAAYNVPGVASGLRLDGPTLVKIFQGNITYWDDSAIHNLQTPSVATTLPHKPLVYVHRSEGSGTTFIFAKYLNSSAPCPGSGPYCWKLGVSTSLGTWPGNSICVAGNGYCPIGSNGNAGVAGTVQGTPYTIGYVELNYALCPSRNAQGCTNVMSVAYVQNHDGTNFVKPSLTNVTYAVQNSTNVLPTGDASWSSVSLSNAPGGYSYPIVSFTYLLVYKELSAVSDLNKDSANALANFLWWVVHQGQGLSPGLFYVPLPQSVLMVDETTIRSITFNGAQLHP